MEKFRFHLVSLAHLPQNKTYNSCAFTQKNIKLAKMLMSLGHEVFFYGPEGSDVECTEFIQTHKISDIRRDYGNGDNRFEIGYDWTNQDFRHDFNTDRKPSTLQFYAKTIEHINKIKKPDDFLLLTQGMYHRPIVEATGLFLACEPGVGYRGSVKAHFRAFESAYIQNFTYGSENPNQSMNGSYYDRVIPNYFDPDDIEFSDTKEDYYLFIGRIIQRKGILTAIEASNILGKKLIIAGQGGTVDPDGKLHDNNPTEFYANPGTWEYVGFADIEKRKKLMAHAKAVFTPTEYLECFAGTHIEAMLSGTPVLTTNFGVFPGTVINGVNGYRCDTLDDFVHFAREAGKLKPGAIAHSAERYYMDNVKWEYQKWFEDLHDVWESATDETKKAWHKIYTGQKSWHDHFDW